MNKDIFMPKNSCPFTFKKTVTQKKEPIDNQNHVERST